VGAYLFKARLARSFSSDRACGGDKRRVIDLPKPSQLRRAGPGPKLIEDAEAD
jgi:hypothetical protein